MNCGIEADSRKLDSRVGARRIYSTAPGHFGIYSESVEPWRSLNDARVVRYEFRFFFQLG